MICNDDRPYNESRKGCRIGEEVKERLRVRGVKVGDKRVGKKSRFVGGSLVLRCVSRVLLGSRVSRGGRRILGA